MRERQEKEYEAAHGRDALLRQRQQAAERWPCCGEWRHGAHHEACSHYVQDAPAVHPGQETLL
jgi:hypothetical protein